MGRMGRAFGSAPGPRALAQDRRPRRHGSRRPQGDRAAAPVRCALPRVRPLRRRGRRAPRRRGAGHRSTRCSRASDFVSLHAAVTDETTGMIGAGSSRGCGRAASSSTPPGRPWSTRTPCVEALRSGHLGGAALDVFAVEPPASDDPLLAAPQRDRDAAHRRQHRGGRDPPGADHRRGSRAPARGRSAALHPEPRGAGRLRLGDAPARAHPGPAGRARRSATARR